MRTLVTGASSGIGAAVSVRIAESALSRGEAAHIAVCGNRSGPQQQRVVQQIQEMGGDAIALVGDLSDPAVPGRLVDEAAEKFGGLDALVANAGIADPGLLTNTSLQDWDAMFSVNVRSAWLLAKASHPHLAASQGAACFTSSMSGQQPHAGSGPYSPTKAALTLLAQTFALEWACDGIRVNVVSPGMTRTGMTDKVYLDPVIEKARTDIIPLGRIGDPLDIANVIEFLISPLAAYVTGQDVCVDGGFSKSILSHIPGRATSK
ncbi:SDR family oxidoreductase (plasmid) [Herbiconiux sp. KACC 21604]|uniref:SDR family NAD(P)-dependent oxidoreductase n=1 Tax=unclassified Herbiconiux TaxID=2618217 RepID=UPI00149268AF|nr:MULTISPECIES: SDR family oxidoreductase [unclassified Herbiconiux]QJU56326.1 SDR family oxidoreductase [Herbiconiux sp. SALV-R1]WPO88833.1 SDR family oxidoreductase [Herbiconiux sp. KACC 21604]